MAASRFRSKVKRAALEAPPRLWEEFQLTKDPKTREALILHYQPFVEAAAKSLLRKMSWGNLGIEEMMSQGQVGMMMAMARYNPERGPFKKFASPYMFGQIIDVCRREDWLPKKYRTAQREMYFAVREYSPDNPPTDKELAQDLGWSVQEIRELKYHLQRAIVLSVSEAGVRVPISPMERTLILSFSKAYRQLDHFEQLAIALRYFGKIPLNGMTKHFPRKAPISEYHASGLNKLYSAMLHEALTSEKPRRDQEE